MMPVESKASTPAFSAVQVWVKLLYLSIAFLSERKGSAFQRAFSHYYSNTWRPVRHTFSSFCSFEDYKILQETFWDLLQKSHLGLYIPIASVLQPQDVSLSLRTSKSQDIQQEEQQANCAMVFESDT